MRLSFPIYRAADGVTLTVQADHDVRFVQGQWRAIGLVVLDQRLFGSCQFLGAHKVLLDCSAHVEGLGLFGSGGMRLQADAGFVRKTN